MFSQSHIFALPDNKKYDGAIFLPFLLKKCTKKGLLLRNPRKTSEYPDTTKWIPSWIEDESDSCIEPFPVSADSMYDILGFIFRYSIWHYMELLKRARKGDVWAKREFASGISSMNFMISVSQNDSLCKPPISPDEILSLLDENEKHWISQFEEIRKEL